MHFISRATPLYDFLRYCNKSKMEKRVLDCGAGGVQPPLYLFYQHGYKTFGIDISEDAIKDSVNFCKKYNLKTSLNIIKGDMRTLDHENDSFPFIYSYNSINHLSKKDILIAMKEIERVLVPNGLCFVNFGSEDSEIGDRGQKIAPGEYLIPIGNNETALHTFHKDNEADIYFRNFKLLQKEKIMHYSYEKGKLLFKIGKINYIARKCQ